MGIYSSNADHDDKIVVGPYDDSRYTSSSGFTYARQPSTQPANSTSQLISPPLLSPPVARVSPGPSSPRSRSPASPQSFQSLNSPSSAGFPLSPYYPPSQENQYLNSPVSDGFYSQRMSGATDPRYSTKAPNMMEMVLETPYFDTPPHTPGDTSFRSTDVVEPTEVPFNNGWRPWWLRRRVASVFMGMCIMLGVIGEVVMWWLSQKDVVSNLKGLWTFGPVVGKLSPRPLLCVAAIFFYASSNIYVVVSIVAILWARVEAQALLYMPWIVLDRKPTTVDETRRKQSHRTILLDYHSLGSFQALNTAFQNRHHLVVAAISIKFLLRAQIVLSTAVFHAEIHVDGTSLLRARVGILHAMAGTFLVISMALLPMLYHAPSPRGIAPRDPTSPAGTATLLSSSHQFLTRLSSTGHANMDTVAARLAGSWYTAELTQPGRRPEEMFQLRQHGGGSGPLCMNPPQCIARDNCNLSTMDPEHPHQDHQHLCLCCVDCWNLCNLWVEGRRRRLESRRQHLRRLDMLTYHHLYCYRCILDSYRHRQPAPGPVFEAHYYQASISGVSGIILYERIWSPYGWKIYEDSGLGSVSCKMYGPTRLVNANLYCWTICRFPSCANGQP